MATETKKRDELDRIIQALHDKGYRCGFTALANYPQSNLQRAGQKPEPCGWDFSVWGGRNGTFVLLAEEAKQEYHLFKDTGTRKVDDDIALL